MARRDLATLYIVLLVWAQLGAQWPADAASSNPGALPNLSLLSIGLLFLQAQTWNCIQLQSKVLHITRADKHHTCHVQAALCAAAGPLTVVQGSALACAAAARDMTPCIWRCTNRCRTGSSPLTAAAARVPNSGRQLVPAPSAGLQATSLIPPVPAGS